METAAGRRGRLGWALLTSAILAVGCGREAPPEAKGVTLVFRHGKVLGERDPMPGLLKAFEREHPGVRVVEEILPVSTNEQHQYYVTNLEGRSAGLDVFSMDVIWVQEFVRAGWLGDLTELYHEGEWADFIPGPLRAATVRGRRYAVPWFVDVGILYYRRDLLEKHGFDPPRTYQELVRSAKAILAREGDRALEGFLWQGRQYEGLVVNALEHIWASGGDVLDPDGGILGIERPEAVRALAFMRDLVGTHGVSPAWVTAADEEMGRRAFGDGRAIYLRNWPYAWDLFQRAGSPVSGKVGFAALPGHPGGEGRGALGGWLLGVNRRTPHPGDASALVRFLTSPASQGRMALEAGFKPVRHSIYRDAGLLRAQPYLRELYPLVLRARPRPATPYYLMLSEVMQAEVSAVLAGLKPAARAALDAERQMEWILALEAPP